MEGEQRAALLHCTGAEQSLKPGPDVEDVHGFAHQNDLEQAVVQVHPVGGQILDPTHGVGVAHHTIEKVILNGLAVVFQLQMVGGDGGQGRDPSHDIGQVSKGVFQLLGGIVCHLGKGPEGGHIDKGAVVEGPNVPL